MCVSLAAFLKLCYYFTNSVYFLIGHFLEITSNDYSGYKSKTPHWSLCEELSVILSASFVHLLLISLHQTRRGDVGCLFQIGLSRASALTAGAVERVPPLFAE